MKNFLILIVSLLIVQAAYSQFSANWRKMRHEVFVGAGTSNFLGDLGGSDGVATHDVRDLNFMSSRWSFQAGYGYKLAERWTVRGSFYYARLYGDDALTNEVNRNGRNLRFRTPILDLTATIDFSIIPEKYGNKMGLKRSNRLRNTPNLYIFTGISGFWFNPRAEKDGKWYSLQPLGTEGQGVVPTRPKYSRIALAIPLGIGVNYVIERDWGIGAEFGLKYTSTDYIDDCSGTYVDPAILQSDEARYFASQTAKPDWKGVGPGQQRGDLNYNDAYMFFTVKATYKIRHKRTYSKF